MKRHEQWEQKIDVRQKQSDVYHQSQPIRLRLAQTYRRQASHTWNPIEKWQLLQKAREQERLARVEGKLAKRLKAKTDRAKLKRNLSMIQHDLQQAKEMQERLKSKK